MDQWAESVGRVQENLECLDDRDLMGLALLLDYPAPWPDRVVPPFAHWLNSNLPARQSELGEDGHPKKGGFLPAIPYPRRMWAGSRVQLLAEFRAGQPLLHRQEIKSVEKKSGRSGDMVFVMLQHDFYCEDTLVLREEQDIVYRAASTAASPQAEPTPGSEAEVLALYEFDWWRSIRPDPVLLFRYSSATANNHRIHYDREYATNIEHYPGLVVHGPLIATLLIDLYQRNNTGQRVSQFTFRSVGALFDGPPFYIMGRQTPGGAELWAVNPQGQVAMKMQLSAEP